MCEDFVQHPRDWLPVVATALAFLIAMVALPLSPKRPQRCFFVDDGFQIRGSDLPLIIVFNKQTETGCAFLVSVEAGVHCHGSCVRLSTPMYT